MTRKMLATIFVCSAFLILRSEKPGLTQTATDVDRKLTGILGQFDRADWESRAQSFYDLFTIAVPGGLGGRTTLIPSALSSLSRQDPERKGQMSLALIRLLEKENAVSHSPINPASEEYSNYRGDLIATVAALKDKRGLNSLLDNILTGNLAVRGLAALGRDSLGRILEIASANTPETGEEMARRTAAARVLSRMLDPDIVQLDETSRNAIKVGLLHASRDEASWVRLSAIEGLSRIPDPDVTVTLRSLAERDPFSRLDPTGHTSYPVRDAARKALAGRAAPTTK